MRVLFVSYDGLTDALGQSQVVPYLQGLSENGHHIDVLSCEKFERFQIEGSHLAQQLNRLGIRWFPLQYHKSPPVLSTLWDLIRMRQTARKLQKRYGYDIVHCRSYIPSLIGQKIKQEFAVPFIFDMRGFWADERIDGKIWNLKHPLYKFIYRYFKKKERQFLKEADHVISLTHRAKQELLSWNLKDKLPIEVIPCGADLNRFSAEQVTAQDVERWRKKLRISPQDLIVTYLGSTGTWYLLKEMLEFFRELLAEYPHAKFLFVTRDAPRAILNTAHSIGLPKKYLLITPAERVEVPQVLSLSHLGLFFIKPVFSKMASSATKLGEMLSMGIPVITNSNVGDQDKILSDYQVGLAVNAFTIPEYQKVIQKIPTVLQLPPSELREAAKNVLSVHEGALAYHRVYGTIYQRLSQGTWRDSISATL